MNYNTHYNKLNERAQNRVLEGYSERHHIIPRCMGGTNDPENIAILTAREHYVADQLLVKIYPKESKLVFALNMMAAGNTGQKRTNKSYAWARKRMAKNISVMNKGKIPWNKGKKHAAETKAKIAAATRQQWKNQEHPRGMKGKKHSAEARAKISAWNQNNLARNT